MLRASLGHGWDSNWDPVSTQRLTENEVLEADGLSEGYAQAQWCWSSVHIYYQWRMADWFLEIYIHAKSTVIIKIGTDK